MDSRRGEAAGGLEQTPSGVVKIWRLFSPSGSLQKPGSPLSWYSESNWNEIISENKDKLQVEKAEKEQEFSNGFEQDNTAHPEPNLSKYSEANHLQNTLRLCPVYWVER